MNIEILSKNQQTKLLKKLMQEVEEKLFENLNIFREKIAILEERIRVIEMRI